MSISSWVRSGAEGETGVGVVREGRAATHFRALLLAIMLVHPSVLVLAGGIKPSAVGRARDMATRSKRSCSGLGFGMMTKQGIGWGGNFLA